MPRLVDGLGRRFQYLRLSITEVCNFRCTYCLPDGYQKTASRPFLTAPEIGRLVETFAALGVGKVRLTGGEPSVRRDVAFIVDGQVPVHRRPDQPQCQRRLPRAGPVSPDHRP